MPGNELMADPKKRPKGRPKAKEQAEDSPATRITIINLKGSLEQAGWLELVHRKTHLSKSVIVRLALNLWAKESGLPPFPELGGDE